MKYLLIKFLKTANKKIVNQICEATLLSYDILDISANVFLVKTKDEFVENLKDIFKTINLELCLDEQFNVFESRNFLNEEELKNHLNCFYNIFKDFDFSLSNPYFTEKNLLEYKYKINVEEDIKKNILGKYYKDKEFLNSLKVFIESNMNTSKASELLYLHRNTLINRIEKFNEYTGYDLRNFKDAYIIYKILK